MAGAGPADTMIDARTLAEWLRAGEADLYDVREPAEFAAERIPGSRLVPLSSFDPAAIGGGAGRRAVLHCKSGVRCGVAAETPLRCGVAAEMLRAAGHPGPLHRLAGGIEAWKSAGGPTEPGT